MPLLTRDRRRELGRLLGALSVGVVLFFAWPARAQVDQWTYPEGASAWWAYDPSVWSDGGEGATGGRLLLEAGLRVALASGLVRDEDAAEVVSALLAAGVVGRYPHRICLLEASARAREGGGFEIGSLSVVLEIRTGGDHLQFIRTIQAILVDGPRARAPEGDPGVQRAIELPGGRRGIAFRRRGWAPWRELSWSSGEESFVFGLGRGALERWFGSPAPATGVPAPASGGDHARHREEVGERGARFAEVWVDLNALRRSAPEAFVSTRLARVSSAGDLENGRALMLHARRVEAEAAGGTALVALDATWAARSDAPGRVRRLVLTESAWPAELRGRASGSFSLVARADWEGWIDRIVRIYAATRSEEAGGEFMRTYARWRGDQLPRVRYLSNLTSGWVVVSDVPRPEIDVVGRGTVVVEIADDPRAGARFRREFPRLMQSLGEAVRQDGGGGFWRLGIVAREDDPKGVLGALVWSLVEREEGMSLVGGWGRGGGG